MSHQETSPRQRYQLGNYEIVETLGSGGMGIVYRANDLALGRSVALKVLRDDLRAQPHIVARFQREAEAIAALDHPNIVHVHNVGRVGKIPFIAMEHIDGYTLGDMLRDGEKLDWRDVLQLGRQIAAALAAAHAAQIIHRDIKPGNILLDHAGRAYVTDFGIAKIMTAATRLTVDGSRLGTPQYMCPERCKNRAITPASDLYSLGVVLFQAIAGRLPHEASSNVELIRKITGEAPPRLSFFVPEVPQDVERLIAFLLEREPGDRPQRAEDVIAAIDRILEGKPLDERHNLAMDAIAAYRDEISTPTPSAGSEESVERVPLSARVREAWFALSVSSRLVIAGIGAVLFVAPIILGFASLIMQPRVMPPDYGPDGGIRAWTHLPALATIHAEAPGVHIVAPSVPGEIATLSPGATLDTVVYRMFESDAGHHSLLSLDPMALETTVIMPPRTLDLASPTSIYGAGDRWLTSTDTGFYSVSTLETDDARLVWDAPVTAWAALPGGAGSLIASPSATGTCNLLLLPQGGLDAPEHLADVAGTIRWIGVSLSSGSAFFAEEVGESTTLWRLSLEGHAAVPKRIASGISTLGHRPLDVSQDRIVITRLDTPDQVEVIDGFTGRVLSRIGAGTHPTWTVDGEHIVVSASDHAGRPQLWSVDANDGTREQLTHIDHGVSEGFVITRSHAVVSDTSKTTLVVAEL